MFPYSSYEEFDFSACRRGQSRIDATRGYLIRVAEMRESLKDHSPGVRQRFRMKGRSRRESARHYPARQREKMKTEMEALIYHFKIFTEGYFRRLPARPL